MSRASLSEGESAYYPPRARWYSRGILDAWSSFLRLSRLERVHLPGTLSMGRFLLCILIPGFAFLTLGRALVGLLFLAVYAGSVAVFMVRLGFTESSIAFGMLIFAHTSSIVFLEGLWLGKERFGLRVVAALCTLVGVWGLFYTPMVKYSQRHLVVPLRAGQQVFVVKSGFSPQKLQRGDWVAYEISENWGGGGAGTRVLLKGGVGLDPVLGLPGDAIRFTPNAVWVNGQSSPTERFMPTSGELVVPEKRWFIWPGRSITVGDRATDNVAELMQRAAMVPQEKILGRPFKRWFWRQQWP